MLDTEGDTVGFALGLILKVGCDVGRPDGLLDKVGDAVGFKLGLVLKVGCDVGQAEGLLDEVGDAVGIVVGATVGLSEDKPKGSTMKSFANVKLWQSLSLNTQPFSAFGLNKLP